MKPSIPSSKPLANTTDAPRRRLSEPVPAPLSRPSSSDEDLSFAAAWGLARRTLGICLLLVTVLLWTVSNFLASVSSSSFSQFRND